MVMGRVCCDSEGRINESSLLLEGCQRHSQGQRTRLDLAKVPEYSVFPGQVNQILPMVLATPACDRAWCVHRCWGSGGSTPVATNFWRRSSLPRHLHPCPPAPLQISPNLLKQQARPSRCMRKVVLEVDSVLHIGESGVLLAIAAGPFTTCKDMSYQPLAELLAQCRQHRPDVLLLLGPFVDVEHPLVQEGLLAAGFDDIFKQQAGLLEYA